MKIAFTPAVYEHAARFVGRTPWEVSRDPELMFEGHRRAYLEYHHQVIVVGIDIYNLEAEAYGSTIEPCEGDASPLSTDLYSRRSKKDSRSSRLIRSATGASPCSSRWHSG